MKKTFLSTLVLIGASLSSFAQLGAGDYAPDFTVTPLNADQVPFHLYAELNADRVVILDVSTTWCGPCWNYHNEGKLEQLHDAYGANGTNELRVIWIEGDPSTTDEDMLGNTGGTMGNWLNPTGSSPIAFPMANPVESEINPIGYGYEIPYFPTLYVICPNRTITEVQQSNTIAELYAMVKACPSASQHVSIEEVAAGGLFNVYPNPATEELNTSLTLNSTEMVTFSIVNAQGQIVMVENLSMNAGTSVQSFYISTLAAGIYTLQISTNEQVSAKAFVKK